MGSYYKARAGLSYKHEQTIQLIKIQILTSSTSARRPRRKYDYQVYN